MINSQVPLHSLGYVCTTLLRFAAFDVLRSADECRLNDLQSGFYLDAVSIATDIIASDRSPLFFAVGTLWSAIKMNTSVKYPNVDSTLAALFLRLEFVVTNTHSITAISSQKSIGESLRRDYRILCGLFKLFPLAGRRFFIIFLQS